MSEAENVRDRLAALLPSPLTHFSWYGREHLRVHGEWPIEIAATLADRLERAAEVERERDELRAAVTRVRLLIDQPNPRYISIAPSVIQYALDGTEATDE